ncbi:MAG: DNA repair protein RecO [Clostridia bacterium]|nr:DNA repair protein RecO [Clostridia bacterium]
MKEEKRLESIVVKVADFGEADKIVTLLTLDEGKRVIKIRGVRKATSKLRYAAQPFLHATYILSPTKANYVLVGCDTIDRFAAISQNLGAYYVAALTCEVACDLSAEDFPDEELYRFILSTLKILNAGEVDDYPYFALKFLVDALMVAGHGLNEDYKETDEYFSYENGGIVPQKTPYSMRLAPSTSRALKALLSGGKADREAYPALFDLLAGYFNVNVQKKLHSHEEIVKMMDLL